MVSIEQLIVFAFGLINVGIFFVGLKRSKSGQAYGDTYWLIPIGIFAWGDALTIGLFWALTSVVVLLLSDWLLFVLTFSVFWFVRSLGEAMYYFMQQFSTVERMPPKKLPGYTLVKNDAIWFVYQTAAQCVAIISLITSVYLFYLWLA